jgi:phage shock protein A
VVGSTLTEMEANHAEAMLDLERETLREQVGKYNQGLAGYAGVIERLKVERARLMKEQAELQPKLKARLLAQDRATAGKYALRIQAIGERQKVIDQELGETDTTYRELVRARELALSSARTRMEDLKRSIDECKVQEALADLSEMTASMSGTLGHSDGTMERVRERLEERKHYAVGRVRVARDGMDVSSLRAQEDEQTALAEDALRQYEERVSSTSET